MYSRYDPTVHDTFLPVGREDTAKTIEFPGAALPETADTEPAAPTASGMQGASPAMADSTGGFGAAAAAATAPRGGLLDGLRGLFGGSSRGLLGDLDLGDIILLLIVALLFLEGGSESELIILLAVALFIGF